MRSKNTHPMTRLGLAVADANPQQDAAETEGANLPPGHDDPQSPMFIPQELRPHWPSVKAQAAEYRGAFDPAHRGRFDAVPGVPSNLVAAAEWLLNRDHKDRTGKEVAWDNVWSPQTLSGRAQRLSTDDKLAYHHHLLLKRARKALAAAQTQEVESARKTCRVCGRVDRTTKVGDPLSELAERSSTPMCLPCAEVLAHLLRERAAADKLSTGGTRREAVQAWLDQTSDS